VGIVRDRGVIMTELDLDPGFTKQHLFDQLGKIEDSQGNKIPRDWVELDDGNKVTGLTLNDAIQIQKVVGNIKPIQRLEIMRAMQESVDDFKKVLNYVRTL
jgi:hypothetical protein